MVIQIPVVLQSGARTALAGAAGRAGAGAATGGAGGVMAAAQGMLVRFAAPIAIGGAALAFLKSISESQKKALQTMTKTSPILSQSQELLQKMWSLGLKPLADVMGIMALQIAISMKNLAVEFQKNAGGLISEATSPTTTTARRGELLKELADMWMDDVVQPLVNEIPAVIPILNTFGVNVRETAKEIQALGGDVIGSANVSITNFFNEMLDSGTNIFSALGIASGIAQGANRAYVNEITKEGGLIKTTDSFKSILADVAGSEKDGSLGKLKDTTSTVITEFNTFADKLRNFVLPNFGAGTISNPIDVIPGIDFPISVGGVWIE